MAAITIPLYYDLDLLLWTSAAGGIARQPNLVLGQSDSIAFAVQFVRSGVVIELTSPAWICGIKPINDTAGDYLCQTTTGVKTGATTTTVYTFTLLLDSTELRAWLLTVTAVSNYAAFSIRDTVNLIATLPAITCTILPDYTLEGTTPTDASGTLIVDSGQTFTVHKTFAMPVDDGQNTYVLKTNGAGVGSWAVDSAGTGTVTSVAQSFTGGIVSVGGTPVTTSGTLALTILGTQGGIVYFTSNSGWASSGAMGQGSLIVGGASGAPPNPVSAQTAGKVLISNGVTTDPIYSSTITLGASGTLGTIAFGNATVLGGILTITPPTGLYSSATITLPSTSTTLAGLAVTQAFTQVNTFSNATASTSTASGAVVITGGLGVGGNAYVGGVINLPATTSTAGQITQGGERFIHTYQPSGQNQNVFIGFQAGRTSVMTGGGNLGIGRAVLQSLTNGSNNLCFGDGVAYAVTSGSSNVMIGKNSANSLTGGSNNVACGIGSLGALVSDNGNTAIGHQALGSQTGGQSVGVGFNSGYKSTGNENVFVGESAGYDTSTIGGLLGVQITSGTNNTMLGQAATSTLITGTYRTAIGSDSRCNADNAIKLGRDTLDRVIFPSWTADPASDLVVGMVIFRSDTSTLKIYTSAGWKTITAT